MRNFSDFKDLALEICLKYGKDEFMKSFLNRLYFTNLARKTLPVYENRHKIFEMMIALNGREKYDTADEKEQEKDYDFIMRSIADIMSDNGVMQAAAKQAIWDEVNNCMKELGLKVSKAKPNPKSSKQPKQNSAEDTAKDSKLKQMIQDELDKFELKELPPLKIIKSTSFIKQLRAMKHKDITHITRTLIDIVDLCLKEAKSHAELTNDIAAKEFFIFASTLLYIAILNEGYEQTTALACVIIATDEIKEHLSSGDIEEFCEVVSDVCCYTNIETDVQENVYKSLLVRLYLSNINNKTIAGSTVAGYVAEFGIKNMGYYSEVALLKYDDFYEAIANLMQDKDIDEIFENEDIYDMIDSCVEEIDLEDIESNIEDDEDE